MLKAIGKYGDYNKYKIELCENMNIENLVKDVVDRLNSIKPKEVIRIYVYQESDMIGRIVDMDEPFHVMSYLSNEEYKIWSQKRRVYRNKVTKALVDELEVDNNAND